MPVREGGRYVADGNGELTLDTADKATVIPVTGALDRHAERVGAEKPVAELEEPAVKAAAIEVPPAPEAPPATDDGATPKSSKSKGN